MTKSNNFRKRKNAQKDEIELKLKVKMTNRLKKQISDPTQHIL